MHIPLVDLQAQFQSIKPQVMVEIESVLESMQLFLGPQSQAFENEFAQYCGTKYGVGLSSGTDALTLALRACEIGQGAGSFVFARRDLPQISSRGRETR